MPIKNTGGSSGKGDPGERKYICNGRKTCHAPGYPSDPDSDPESDAAERRNRVAASAFSFQYTAAGGCDIYGCGEHEAKNTSLSHLNKFYETFTDIKKSKFDGMIITGAPVEQMPFEEVDYWNELTEIMDWTEKHVTSTIFLCWAAQASLYHFYGLEKKPLDKKMFGLSSTGTEP